MYNVPSKTEKLLILIVSLGFCVIEADNTYEEEEKAFGYTKNLHIVEYILVLNNCFFLSQIKCKFAHKLLCIFIKHNIFTCYPPNMLHAKLKTHLY